MCVCVCVCFFFQLQPTLACCSISSNANEIEEEAERSQRNKELLPSEKNLGHMTVEEKYDFARKYKDAGNVFFKEGRYVPEPREGRVCACVC